MRPLLMLMINVSVGGASVAFGTPDDDFVVQTLQEGMAVIIFLFTCLLLVEMVYEVSGLAHINVFWQHCAVSLPVGLWAGRIWRLPVGPLMAGGIWLAMGCEVQFAAMHSAASGMRCNGDARFSIWLVGGASVAAQFWPLLMLALRITDHTTLVMQTVCVRQMHAWIDATTLLVLLDHIQLHCREWNASMLQMCKCACEPVTKARLDIYPFIGDEVCQYSEQLSCKWNAHLDKSCERFDMQWKDAVKHCQQHIKDVLDVFIDEICEHEGAPEIQWDGHYPVKVYNLFVIAGHPCKVATPTPLLMKPWLHLAMLSSSALSTWRSLLFGGCRLTPSSLGALLPLLSGSCVQPFPSVMALLMTALCLLAQIE
mmetsp:Transcript_47664/g.111177  ORF Transcript_47664/g.111177 Transcript_47664/m.111177 type:complete len:369 (+) Transcript_47664:186-1292(+)